MDCFWHRRERGSRAVGDNAIGAQLMLSLHRAHGGLCLGVIEIVASGIAAHAQLPPHRKRFADGSCRVSGPDPRAALRREHLLLASATQLNKRLSQPPGTGDLWVQPRK